MTTTSKYNQITSSIINKVDNNGWSVLHEAVRSKSIISIKILLDKGADKYKVNNAGDNSINLVNQFIRKFEKLLELLRKHIFLQSYSVSIFALFACVLYLAKSHLLLYSVSCELSFFFCFILLMLVESCQVINDCRIIIAFFKYSMLF